MINSRITYNTYTCQRDFETRLLVVCVNVGENGGLQCYSYGHAVKKCSIAEFAVCGLEWYARRSAYIENTRDGSAIIDGSLVDFVPRALPRFDIWFELDFESSVPIRFESEGSI